MIPNVFLMSSAPDPKPNNSNNNIGSFIEIAKMMVSKSKLTRGQMFYLLFLLFYFIFIVLMAVAPTAVYLAAIIFGRELSEVQPPIPLDKLLNGLYIVLVVGIFYIVAYAIPELRDRWNTKKKSNN